MNFSLPKPIDEHGRELSAETIEKLNNEPTFVRVRVEQNDAVGVFTVAADFAKVLSEADEAYQALNGERYKIIANDQQLREKQRRAAAKELGVGVEEVELQENLSGDANALLIAMLPRERKVFTDLCLPCVLGHDVPRMPPMGATGEVTGDERRAVRAWFESGNPTVQAVLEAMVMAYDPTGPLAEKKLRRELQKQFSEELMSKMLETASAQTEPTSETEPGTEMETPNLETPNLETLETISSESEVSATTGTAISLASVEPARA